MRLSDLNRSLVATLRRETPVSFLVATLFMSLVGCAARAQTTFHPTDASFTARSRSSDPKVYLHAEDVPSGALRSVGIIEVRGIDAEVKAAAKGRELGCWAVIDHAVFVKMQRVRTENAPLGNASDTNALLAHGGAPHVETTRIPQNTKFDCVMTESNQSPKPFVM